VAYDQGIHIIETPPVSTVGRHKIDGIKVYQSLSEAVSVLEEMLYQQSLGNGHVWKYEINGRKIHSIQVITPLGMAWLVIPSMTRTEIQDVIDEVGVEGGGNFYFMEGEYLLEDPLLIRHSNIHIYGQNLNTVLKCNGDWRYAISKVGGGLLPIESRNSTDGEYAGIIDIRGAEEAVLENIKISGIRLDGNRATAYSYGIYSKYVGLAQTTGLTEGVGRYDSTTVGNTMPNKIGMRIENCVVEDCRSYGVYLNTSMNCKLVNNTVQNNSNGINLNSSANNTVTGNTVQNNSNNGIYLYPSSTNNTITGNTVQNNSGNGIFLYSSSNNNTITGNTVQNNANIGIVLKSSANNKNITSNNVQNNGGIGIYLSSSTNNTVTGNTVQNNSGIGIYLASSSSNNTITGNTVQNNSSQGIYLISSSNNTVTGNISVSNSATNILISSAANYNIICSNQHGSSISNSGTGNKVYNNK
jgi:parallel beta-helix repeat protein